MSDTTAPEETGRYLAESDDEARAVDLEIYEAPPIPDDWTPGVIKPNRIRINGVECLTPDDCPVQFYPVLDGSVLKATITVFVRSLSVHGGRGPS